MNFSKTDEIFVRASLDETAIKALLQKTKKTRRFLVWVFWGNVTFLIAAAIFCFYRVAPILKGDFASFNPSFPIRPEVAMAAIGFSGWLGVCSIIGLVAADHRVKMLILIDGLEGKLRCGTQS